jgi:dTDP-4-amino-4,6-dideoxygalactose transaminase
MGLCGCFSFYPGKNLGAYGEGGAVVASDPDIVKKLRMLRDWGSARRYEHTLKGFNYRMDGIQGAILGVKMKHIEAWTEARRSRAAVYARTLADVPMQLPKERPGSRHVYHVYAVRTPERQRIHEALLEQGIHTGIHYPIPVHLQPAHADLGYEKGDFPVAERLAGEVLSLPMFPELTDTQIDEIGRVVRRIDDHEITKPRIHENHEITKNIDAVRRRSGANRTACDLRAFRVFRAFRDSAFRGLLT